MALVNQARLTELTVAEAERDTLREQLDTLTRQHDHTLVLIAGATPLLVQLGEISAPDTNPGTTAGQPTTDGQGWRVDFAEMAAVIVPTKDEIQLVPPQGVAMGIRAFKLNDDGTVPETTQYELMGYARAIKRAVAEGTNPVVDGASALSVPVTA